MSGQREQGHGHVYRRDDGQKARCGGPGLCAECSRDLGSLAASTRPMSGSDAFQNAVEAEIQATFNRARKS